MRTSFGPYTIQAKIAEGGMAEVFLATKHGADGWQQQVVAKRILPHFADQQEFRRLFLHEAHIATQLKHPNLLAIEDYTEVDGEFFIVAEYLAGKDLHELTQRSRQVADGQLTWQQVAFITFEVLKALHYLHSQKPAILHRDVSPQNIFITYDGQVKLLDMGIAELDRGDRNTQETMRGKRAYLPPDYLSGGEYTKSSELYSLALAMRPLLDQKDVPTDLANIFAKAAAAKPLARYQDTEAMRRDLTLLLSQMQVSAAAVESDLKQKMQLLYPLASDRHHQAIESTQPLVSRRDTSRPVWHWLAVSGMGCVLVLAIIAWPMKIAKLTTPQRFVSQLIDASSGPIYHRPISGTLNVDSYPWSSVYLNGKFLGITPLREMEVPSGDYQLYLVTRDGRSIEMPLQIEPGKSRQLFQQIP